MIDTGIAGKNAKRYKEKFGLDMIPDNVTLMDMEIFSNEDEFEEFTTYKNPATQLINNRPK